MVAEPLVVCPKCGHRFPVTKALTAEIEASLRGEFEAQAEQREKASQAAFEKRLAAERAKLERLADIRAAKASAAELAELRATLTAAEKRAKAAKAAFDRRLIAEKSRLQREALSAARASISEEMATLRQRMEKSNVELQKMRKKELEVRELEMSLRAKEQNFEKTLTRETELARKKAFSDATEKVEKEHLTKELQHEKVVNDLKKQLGDAKRKLEQSSQQSQGAVIERELEKMLSTTFPDDDICPITTGKLGADIIQRVRTPNEQLCGTIVWESKNTRNWNKGWIAKLRSDQRREKAELAVLVSAVLPEQLKSRLGQISGVWVTDFSLAIGLATALRAGLMEVALIRSATRDKTEKMEILYQYLMSTEFRQRVEAIVESFTTMREDLEREKRATEKNWAKREKGLELVLQNVSGMVGGIQAITPAFPKIRRLELPAAP